MTASTTMIGPALGGWLGALAVLTAGCTEEEMGGGGSGGSLAGGGGAGAEGGEGGLGGLGAAGGSGPAEVPFGLNDVSVLFPLPDSVDAAGVLRLDDVGAGGPLLSPQRYGAIPEFQAPTPLDYDAWIVVAVRIDPCFPDLANLVSAPELCRRQLRLVAQPFVPAPDTMLLGAADHALHLLYDLPEDTFAALLADWYVAKPTPLSDPAERLDVNPTLVAEGLAGPYGTRLRDLILAYAGDATLSQLTFMRSRSVAWDFGGYAVVGGALTPLLIHGLPPPGDRVEFGVVSEAAPFEVDPLSPESSVLMNLAGEVVAGELALTATHSEIQAALQLSFDLDDPTRFNPDTTDCASCHVSARARARAESLGASLSDLERYASDVYDLTLTVPADEQRNLMQLRGFGWNRTQPIFMQRTINESAAVAAALSDLISQ